MEEDNVIYVQVDEHGRVINYTANSNIGDQVTTNRKLAQTLLKYSWSFLIFKYPTAENCFGYIGEFAFEYNLMEFLMFQLILLQEGQDGQTAEPAQSTSTVASSAATVFPAQPTVQTITKPTMINIGNKSTTTGGLQVISATSAPLRSPVCSIRFTYHSAVRCHRHR